MSPSVPRSFWFGQANSSGRRGKQGQCSSRRHCGSWIAGQRLWRTWRACTTTVAQGNTRWQTKARARRGVVFWLTSDATSMCVGADQEHSSLMGEHCLGCSTLPTFKLPWKKVTCARNPVCARACMQNPTKWHGGFRGVLPVPPVKRRGGACLSQPTCPPATKIDQCTQKARTKNAHAKYFVLHHPVSRPDKICMHVQTCQRNTRRRSKL